MDAFFSNFLLTLNNLLQQHAPLKKLSNKDKNIDKYIYIYKIYQNKKCFQKRKTV